LQRYDRVCVEHVTVAVNMTKQVGNFDRVERRIVNEHIPIAER